MESLIELKRKKDVLSSHTIVEPIIVEPIVVEEILLLEDKELEEPTISEEIFNELDEMLRVNHIEEPAISEIENVTKDTCCKEILELKLLVNSMTKECVEIVKISKEILKSDLKHTKQYVDVANSHLEIKKDHYKINKSLNIMKFKYAFFYIIIGGLIVNMFPTIMPYVKWLLNFIFKGL